MTTQTSAPIGIAKQLEQTFGVLNKLMEQEAKKYNEEHKRVQEQLNNGARITKHRIHL